MIKDSLRWIRDSIGSRDIAQYLTSYLIRGGMIYATNGRMLAAHPFPDLGRDALVPGEEFERLVMSMPDDPEFIFSDSRLRVKKGCFKGEVSLADPGSWPFPDLHDGDWAPLPERFIPILKSLRPFISDNASKEWATCIGILPGWALATNNIVIARAAIESAYHGLVPFWAVDFILPRAEGLAGWAMTDSGIYFKWENGAWMRSVLITGEFPSMAQTLIESALQNEMHPISDEWKETYRRVAGLTKGVDIEIGAQMIRSGWKDSMQVEDELESPCSAQGPSYWSDEFLSKVIEQAREWNPAVYPSPAPWRGEFCEGLIAPRRPPGS